MFRAMVAPILLTAVMMMASGCKNPCQSLCVEMAAYAEECGLTVSDSDVQSCVDDQKDADDQGSCRRVGGAETLRQEWTCDDVRVFLEG